MPKLEDEYWARQEILLEACRSLEENVSASLEEGAQCTCSFRVIDLLNLGPLAEMSAASGHDVWKESAEIILGRVTAPTREKLDDILEIVSKLFTVNQYNSADSVAVCIVPPWAKPAAWNESITLPTFLTIRYSLQPTALEHAEAETLSLFRPLTLALSGGGVRATLYQLGILIFLAQQNRLKDVQEIVSVSGGSIAAAHFLKHWTDAVRGLSGFRSVAAVLVRITRSNIRNRVFIPWLWSRLAPWCWFSRRRGRAGRLQAEYHRIFQATTLGDLGTGRPNVAIVATDGIRQERVAFTASQILRWRMQQDDDRSMPTTILSKGVELSLAVAASSCFPPVFPRLHLTHIDLGITYREFKEELHLNDGGVMTNLGIEVLVALRQLGWTKNTQILIADAERDLAKRPNDSPLADVDASLAALGKAARESAKREFGERAIPIPFADRVEGNEGLAFRTETSLFDYRTDLDCPTWQEIHALMLHGAMVARQATHGRFEAVSPQTLKQLIVTIIAEAGGPSDLQVPTEVDLRRCGKRPYGRVIVHIVLIAFSVCLALWLVRYITHNRANGSLAKNPTKSGDDGVLYDEPLEPDALPAPSSEPDFPSPAQIAEATSRDLSSVFLLYHNRTSIRLRLILFDCSQYYASRASPAATFATSCFRELPFDISGEPLRFSKFRVASNWYGVYVCRQAEERFTLIGFRDLTRHKVWRIEVQEQRGVLKGEFVGEKSM